MKPFQVSKSKSILRPYYVLTTPFTFPLGPHYALVSKTSSQRPRKHPVYVWVFFLSRLKHSVAARTVISLVSPSISHSPNGWEPKRRRSTCNVPPGGQPHWLKRIQLMSSINQDDDHEVRHIMKVYCPPCIFYL